jgi:methyl-accepting chemotaxis protein
MIDDLNVKNKFYLLGVAAMVLGLTAALLEEALGRPTIANGLFWAINLPPALIVLAGANWLGTRVARRTEKLVAAMHALAEGDLTHRVAIKGRDEFSWLAYEFDCVRKSMEKTVGAMAGNAAQLAAAAEELSAITEQSREGVARQNAETEQVAAAMNEMSATVVEVARYAADAASAATEADRESKDGNRVVQATVHSISGLAQEVERTAGAIARLKDDSLAIGAVLDVIRDIADQTNLLALNAAIEAARAGEQGRGFAVVADEVRSLASRTQQSTQEIQGMIERLQAGANEAVNAMQEGRRSAESSVGQAGEAGGSLDRITRMAERIKGMNLQISNAADQQSQAAEEINRSVVRISQIGAQTSTGAQQIAQASDDLARLAAQLQDMVGKFKVAQRG